MFPLWTPDPPSVGTGKIKSRKMATGTSVLDSSVEAENVEIRASKLPTTTSSSSTRTTSTTAIGKGMFLVGKKRLGFGDRFCSMVGPVIEAVDTARLEEVCYYCHVRGREQQDDGGEKQLELKACTGCRVVRYCGKKCQKASWTEHHKLECPIFSSLRPRILPNVVRAVMRLVLQREAGKISDQQWTEVTECSAHVDQFMSGNKDVVQDLMMMAQAVKNYGKCSMDVRKIFELFCRLKINSVTLSTEWYDPVGIAMHPLLAKINHSCRPNAYVRFVPLNRTANDEGYNRTRHRIEVRPLLDINPGEEITISYIEETEPLHLRRQQLLSRYFFHCQCEKCTIEEEEDLSSASTTNGTYHPSVFLKRKRSLQEEAQNLIDEIDVEKDQPTTEQATLTVKRIRRSIHDLRSAYNSPSLASRFTAISQPTTKSTIPIFTESTPSWPLTLHPLPQLLSRLTTTYISLQNHTSALHIALLRFLVTDPPRYTITPTHPIPLVHAYVLLKLINLAISEPSHATHKYGDIDLVFWRRQIFGFLRDRIHMANLDLELLLPLEDHPPDIKGLYMNGKLSIERNGTATRLEIDGVNDDQIQRMCSVLEGIVSDLIDGSNEHAV